MRSLWDVWPGSWCPQHQRPMPECYPVTPFCQLAGPAPSLLPQTPAPSREDGLSWQEARGSVVLNAQTHHSLGRALAPPSSLH